MLEFRWPCPRDIQKILQVCEKVIVKCRARCLGFGGATDDVYCAIRVSLASFVMFLGCLHDGPTRAPT